MVASRASTRRRGCGVCPRGGWLSSPRSVGGMAADVAVAGRRRRNKAGDSGDVLSGSRGGGPGRWWRVKLGLPAAAWRGVVPVQGGSASAVSWFLLRIGLDQRRWRASGIHLGGSRGLARWGWEPSSQAPLEAHSGSGRCARTPTVALLLRLVAGSRRLDLGL